MIRRTDVNVAKVFPLLPGRQDREHPGQWKRKPEDLPETWMGRVVIDGDKHDLRFPPFDPKGVIIGLRAKGNAMQADVKKLRVLTPDEYDRTLEEGKLTPAQQFMLSGIAARDSVHDSRMDDTALRRWLEKVAADFIHGEHLAGPWSSTIGADVWSFATSGKGVLGLRIDLGYPPMPKKVSEVLLSQWLEGMLGERRRAGVMTAAALLKVCGGVPRGTYNQNDPLWVRIGGTDFDGHLIASSLRGAYPSEQVRVDLMEDPWKRKDYPPMLLLFGSGWISSLLSRVGEADVPNERILFS